MHRHGAALQNDINSEYKYEIYKCIPNKRWRGKTPWDDMKKPREEPESIAIV